MAEGMEFEIFVNSSKRGKWTVELKPLNTITPEQFSLMLNGWYEVIDDIQVGDWVKYKDGNEYYKIVDVYPKGPASYKELILDFVNEYSELFEKVTEEWQTMLLELGREKPEFKEGDIYRTSDICRTELVTLLIVTEEDKKDCKIHFEAGEVKYFYPVESRIEVKNQ